MKEKEIIVEQQKQPESIKFFFAKELKQMINQLTDNHIIICQVVGQDGSAWNCNGEICLNISPNDPKNKIAVITFSHPNLKTLPK